MSDYERRVALAKALGWYQLNGAWMHPQGYARPLPSLATLKEHMKEPIEWHEKYPEFFSGHSVGGCGVGWNELLTRLFEEVFRITKQSGIRIEMEQIKEKFGGLRVYHTTQLPEGYTLGSGILGAKLGRLWWLGSSRLHLYKSWTRKWDRWVSVLRSWGNDWLARSVVSRGTGRRSWKLLRAYNKIERLFDKAEEESFSTCEECGDPGKPRPGGWIKTECERCWFNSRVNIAINNAFWEFLDVQRDHRLEHAIDQIKRMEEERTRKENGKG